MRWPDGSAAQVLRLVTVKQAQRELIFAGLVPFIAGAGAEILSMAHFS